MTIGHCLRDHGTATKNTFDSVTRSLTEIEKEYIWARGCVLSKSVKLLGAVRASRINVT